MYENRMSVVQLSRGADWNPRPQDPPYLLADYAHPWPDGGIAWAIFRDSSGGELLTVELDVTPGAIQPYAENNLVEPIPAGANFEIFLEHAGGVDQIRHGKVIRKQAEFTNAPATQISNQALMFADTFPTLGLRSNWKAVDGRTKVHDNSAFSLPNSVGPSFPALFSKSAIRWDTPLNGDSARVRVTVIDPSPISVQSKTTVILCADQRCTSFLAAQFQSSTVTGNNKLRLVTGTGPYALTDRVTPITHNVVNGDGYTIVYDDLTRKLFIYEGEETTPLLSWQDTLGVMPHGPGYRYLAMAFEASLTPLGRGVQVTGWQAQDGA